MQSKPDGIYSVIDLGTNTCLLLIAALSQNKLSRLFEVQETPRIGKNLYETGNISSDRFEIVSEIFKKYILVSKEHKSDRIVAVGTSALREAGNSSEFIIFIDKETGIRINVISGEEEAKYSFEGAVYDLTENSEYAVLDIGGGSTEISFINDTKLISISLKIGSVRLFENFFKENFGNENILKAQMFVKENITQTNFEIYENVRLVGVSGTVTTLSAIKNRLRVFSEDKIHKDVLTLNEVRDIFQDLIRMTGSERLNLGEFMKGRSDIIICGAMILIEIMEHFNFKSIIVSTKGLRYGLMLNIADFFY